MCTVSWLYHKTGYGLFFNRDEQKSRPKALAPAVFENPVGEHYLMPQDPQGKGTWMGVTEQGISVCLLNFYQGNIPSGQLISRGLLVRTLLEKTSHRAMLHYLSSVDCYQFAPFTILIFDPQHICPTGFCWTGDELKSIHVQSPYTSSGVDFPLVSKHRQASFTQYFSSTDASLDTQRLDDYHRSHLPEKSMLSVCMHRDDAQTVSLNKIQVETDSIRYQYWDGSPCETPESSTIELQRHRETITNK